MAKRKLSTEQRAARELRAVEREERKLDAIRARLNARAKSAAEKLERELKRKAEARRKAEAKEHAELQRVFSGIKRHELKRRTKPKKRSPSKALVLPAGYFVDAVGAGLVTVRTRRGTHLPSLDGRSTAYTHTEAKKVAAKHQRAMRAAEAKPKKRKAKKSGGKLTGAAKAEFLRRMAKGRKKAKKR